MKIVCISAYFAIVNFIISIIEILHNFKRLTWVITTVYLKSHNVHMYKGAYPGLGAYHTKAKKCTWGLIREVHLPGRLRYTMYFLLSHNSFYIPGIVRLDTQ